MPGVPDPLYVAARHALLDAIEALSAHLDAVVLVGAQAVYLHTGSTRALDVSVAGPAGLLVAKIFKIGERAGGADRRSDKDALDVFRLLQAVSTDEFARRMRALRAEERSRAVTEQALAQLPVLFGSPRAIGSTMAARAAAPLEAEDTIAAATAVLARDLIVAMG